MDLKLHHVGYTVADISVSAKRFEHFGYRAGEVLHDRDLQVELCYLVKEGAVTVELVRQLQPDSLEARLLEVNGVMPYHLCYEAVAFGEACADLESQGYKRLFDPVPVRALGGRRICYFHHPAVGYVELVSVR